jgi:hypothetical protein
LTASLNL